MIYSDEDPYVYLTVQNVKSKDIKEEEAQEPIINVHLSDTKKVSERSAFTIIMLLGEVGGLYGAIVGFPAYFISCFVESSFKSAIAELAPVKKDDGDDDQSEERSEASTPQL